MPYKERKKISQADKQEWMLGLFVLILVTLAMLNIKPNICTTNDVEAAKNKIIVIDPGHGGKDPGKIGVNQAEEKEINLKVSMFLKKELEKKGFQVCMTREEDTTATGEYEGAKSADMRRRVEIMEESGADVCISVHMNSFESGKTFGPQLFFYEESVEGRELAEKIQEELTNIVCPEGKRKEKGNREYYILKKSPCPAVIVECGFLSNPQEAEKLVDEGYQKKLAKGICVGIMNYFSP